MLCPKKKESEIMSQNVITHWCQLEEKEAGVWAVPEGVTEIKCDENHYPPFFDTLEVSATVEKAEGTAHIANCNEINVDPNNPTYCSIGGVMYTKDRKTLVAYPQGRVPLKGKKLNYTYHVPLGTKKIEDKAFVDNRSLKAVVLPYGLERIGVRAFSHCLDLFTIIIPDTVTYIGNHCFEDSNRINRIHFPPHTDPLYTSNLSNGIVVEIDDTVTNLEVDCVPAGFSVKCVYLPDLPLVKPILLCHNNLVVEKFAAQAGFRCISDYVTDKDEIIWSGKELICFPAEWKEDRYQLPAWVKTVYSCAFSATSLDFLWAYRKIPFSPTNEMLDMIIPGSRRPGAKKAYELRPEKLPFTSYLPEEDPLNYENDYREMNRSKPAGHDEDDYDNCDDFESYNDY